MGIGDYRIVGREGQMPQIVHHDRLRKYLEADPAATPRWVTEAVAAFAKRTFQTKAQQVEDRDLDQSTGSDTNSSTSGDSESDDSDSDGDTTGVKALNARTCVICKESRFDQQGIFRVIDDDGRCHLCKQTKV